MNFGPQGRIATLSRGRLTPALAPLALLVFRRECHGGAAATNPRV